MFAFCTAAPNLIRLNIFLWSPSTLALAERLKWNFSSNDLDHKIFFLAHH